MGFLLFFVRFLAVTSCILMAGFSRADYVIQSNTLFSSFDAELEVIHGNISPFAQKLSLVENNNVTTEEEIYEICTILESNLTDSILSLENFMSINQFAQLSMEDFQTHSTEGATDFFWNAFFELQHEVNTTISIANSIFSFCNDSPDERYELQLTGWRTKNSNYGNTNQLLKSINYFLKRVDEHRTKVGQVDSQDKNYILSVDNALRKFQFTAEEIDTLFKPYIFYSQEP